MPTHAQCENIQNLSYTLSAFEIFEIAQKTKKLVLSSYSLGSCQGVPVSAQAYLVREPKFFFQRWLYTTESYVKKNFGIFSAHLRYLPVAPFSRQTQHAIFRIEYNAFSRTKFGNFQKLLKLNIYLLTVIIGEKTQFELNLTSFKLRRAEGGPDQLRRTGAK